MFGRFLLSLVLALLFIQGVYSQQLPVQKIVADKWIKTWLLCGPVPLEAPAGDEKMLGHFSGYDG
jgi:hypothetical protein